MEFAIIEPMYCPNCRVEYRPGFDTCSDCGVALVEEPPSDPVAEPVRLVPTGALVTVWETYDFFALSFAKSVLESADIPYLSPNENFQRMFGHTSPLLGVSPALGGFSLQVSEADAADARELLAEVEERRFFADEEDEQPE
ncbi:MAG: DUF2007 domain-containing protein [Bryobacterales bacterium]